MNMRINWIYLGLFLNFPLMGFFRLFFPYSGHTRIQNKFKIKSSVAKPFFIKWLFGIPLRNFAFLCKKHWNIVFVPTSNPLSAMKKTCFFSFGLTNTDKSCKVKPGTHKKKLGQFDFKLTSTSDSAININPASGTICWQRAKFATSKY